MLRSALCSFLGDNSGHCSRKQSWLLMQKSIIRCCNILYISLQVDAKVSTCFHILVYASTLGGDWKLFEGSSLVEEGVVIFVTNQSALVDRNARRIEVLGRSASIIQRKIRSYMDRKSFILFRRCVLQIQSMCRGQLARQVYSRMLREASCLKIQRDLRMHLARKANKELCSSAVSIQSGMRAMNARNELRFRRQTRAAIIIQ